MTTPSPPRPTSLPAPPLGVAHTIDGGATWTPLVDVPVDVQGVCFTAHDDGWLATRTAAYHSTDGGTTWALALQQPASESNDETTTLQCTASAAAWVEFASRSTGAWTLGHLADGGARFMPVAADGAASTPKNAAAGGNTHASPYAVIDSLNAFVVELSPNDETLDGIFVTSIGESSPPGVITQSVVGGASFTPTAVSFADKSHGVVVGAAGRGRPSIYATADGGATWTRAVMPDDSPVTPPMSASQGS